MSQTGFAFRCIVIVNRGEPAMRLIDAVREWNAEGRPALRVIVVYTAADRHATFVREADESVLIGPDDPDAAVAGGPYLNNAELHERRHGGVPLRTRPEVSSRLAQRGAEHRRAISGRDRRQRSSRRVISPGVRLPAAAVSGIQALQELLRDAEESGEIGPWLPGPASPRRSPVTPNIRRRPTGSCRSSA